MHIRALLVYLYLITSNVSICFVYINVKLHTKALDTVIHLFYDNCCCFNFTQGNTQPEITQILDQRTSTHITQDLKRALAEAW